MTNLNIGWFKSLKKWQKGGIIGCAVGVVITTLLVFPGPVDLLTPIWLYNLQQWLIELHAIPILFLMLTMTFPPIESLVPEFVLYIVQFLLFAVLYGGYGAIVGRVRQVDNPTKSWLLTGLLVVLLLFIYWVNIKIW